MIDLRALTITLALISGVLTGCEREHTLPLVEFEVEFETGEVIIATTSDTFTLGVEIAETETQRQRGLMQRTSLAPDSGMIFLFQQDQKPDDVFWMYNTLIPLSIAFLDAEGVIGSIHNMEPCTSPYPQYCPNYAAGVPFRAALEVNRGYFEEHQIGVGDRVTLAQE